MPITVEPTVIVDARRSFLVAPLLAAPVLAAALLLLIAAIVLSPTPIVAQVADAQATVARAADAPSPPVLTEVEEITLARSAAPATVTENATILVLREGTYEVGHEGASGVTCMVSRTQPLSLEPICYDPEAARTILPMEIRRIEMRLAGVEAEEIERRLAEAIGSGELALPERPAMAYMMSAGQELYSDAETRVGAWKPHMHLYIPYATAEQFGGLGEGSGAAAYIFDAGKPTANLVVPLREFVQPVAASNY